MINLLSLIIFIGSLIGICAIVLRKIPALQEIPKQEIGSAGFFMNLKNRVSAVSGRKNFSFDNILQKVLLKTEQKTNFWLKKIKQKTEEDKKNYDSDNYWQELKISADTSFQKPKRAGRVVKAKAKPKKIKEEVIEKVIEIEAKE